MDTDLLPNVRGNVRTLRNMWSERAQEEQQLLKPKPTTYRSHSQLLQKPSISDKIETSKSIDETIINRKPTITFDDEKPLDLKPIEQTLSVESTDDFLPLPSPPPSAIFKQQAQSIATLKQSVGKIFDTDKPKIRYNDVKNKGIRHWHIARHVFRSGLIFGPSRRASDSIIPLLMKTHIAQYRSRRDSLDSVRTETPFENLIDYLAYNNNDNENLNISKKLIVKRATSDTSACIQRNKLNDTIAQYETIMRHLKNYDKFMAIYPVPSPVPSTRKTNDTQKKLSVKNRQTQSLARSVGRTFTEFIMNDLLLSPSTKTPTNERRHLNVAHTASQTDLIELAQKNDSIEITPIIEPIEITPTMESNEITSIIDSIPTEELKEMQNEFNTTIDHTDNEVALTPNSEINVIVINTPVEKEEKNEMQPPKEPTFMQRLFEGKKTAYTPNDLHMVSTRIPEELMNTFEVAKKKCFFPEEHIVYASKMIKIDRRGYKQHVRILCLTSDRVYIITKKDPYPKEAVLFKDILGVTCTPYKDGFICLHTRETREDRGDWLFIVDHPCEFITQLFMTMGRDHNNDNFLKIKTKFKHTRRNIATLTDEGLIEVRASDVFRIAFEDYEVLAIYTP